MANYTYSMKILLTERKNRVHTSIQRSNSALYLASHLRGFAASCETRRVLLMAANLRVALVKA